MSPLISNVVRKSRSLLIDFAPTVVSGQIVEYSPVGNPITAAIAVGSDNNFWVALEDGTARILRVALDGTMTFFALPRAGNLGGICNGPDSRIWFTEFTNARVSAIDVTSGVVTSWTLPTSPAAGVAGIVSDGSNLWIMLTGRNSIGKVTTAGALTEYAIPTAGAFPHGPSIGHDGNIWFCEELKDKIAVINKTTGVITEYPCAAGSLPFAIAKGADGNMWFTEFNGNRVSKITPAGVITGFAIPTGSPGSGPSSGPKGICQGPVADGAVWFAESRTDKVGRCSMSGIITEYMTPTAASSPDRLVRATDGNVWFTEHDAGKVARVTP